MKITVFADIEAARNINHDINVMANVEVKTKIADKLITGILERLYEELYGLISAEALRFYAEMQGSWDIEEALKTNEVET